MPGLQHRDEFYKGRGITIRVFTHPSRYQAGFWDVEIWDGRYWRPASWRRSLIEELTLITEKEAFARAPVFFMEDISRYVQNL